MYARVRLHTNSFFRLPLSLFLLVALRPPRRYRRGVGGWIPGIPIETSLREIYRLRRVCEFEISPIRIAPAVASLFSPSAPSVLSPSIIPAEEQLRNLLGTISGIVKQCREGEREREKIQSNSRTSWPTIKIRWIIADNIVAPSLPCLVDSFYVSFTNCSNFFL